MSIYVVFIILILQILQQAQASKILSRVKRIVHGVNALPGEFPYQVSIQNYDATYHHCGGIILNEYFILTAAHCVYGFEPDEMCVIAGTVNLRQKKFSKQNIAEIIVPKDFDLYKYLINDIALVKVEKPYRFNQLLAPAILNPDNSEITPNTQGVIVGFGKMEEHSYGSNTLKYGLINITDLDFCREMYKKVQKNKYKITSSNICGYSILGNGICMGDSGGPLIINNNIVGLASWVNKGCSDSKYPSVYTKIYDYIDWINENIQIDKPADAA